MIINRITRNLFPSFTLCGLSVAEVQSRLINVNEIRSASEAVSDDGLICVIYDDVPLITDELIRSLGKTALAENTGFSLGDGYIVKKGYHGVLTPCSDPLAEKFTPENYSRVVKTIKSYILKEHTKNGVIIPDPDSVFIDFDVKICSKAVIRPNVTIEGNSYIGKGTYIGENTVIKNSHIGDECRLSSCTVEDSRTGDRTKLGPYSYLRNNAVVGNDCRIGDFVEIKNSRLGDGVKAAHLAYIGDADIGDGTNVGCGTVFCNYDGKNKHRSVVGKNVFIGANVNLVAPITIESGVFIAAGSTVTRSVPENAFVIARARQIVK